jgi:hypothetical protein
LDALDRCLYSAIHNDYEWNDMYLGGQPRSDSQKTDTHSSATAALPLQPTRDVQHARGSAANWSGWSLSAVAAGLLAILVSFPGPLAILYQAAQVAHVSSDMSASWVWGVSIGAGVAGIALSWYFRAPVIAAWPAPGTALLIALFPGCHSARLSAPT